MAVDWDKIDINDAPIVLEALQRARMKLAAGVGIASVSSSGQSASFYAGDIPTLDRLIKQFEQKTRGHISTRVTHPKITKGF